MVKQLWEDKLKALVHPKLVKEDIEEEDNQASDHEEQQG